MLNHLVDGMQQAGAQVETVDLRKKDIRFCVGCFTCWTKTPGQCLHQDDMTKEIFAKWLAADIAVYATPLYHFTMNAAMKTFVERTLPVLKPFFESTGAGTRHPMRHNPPKAVWVSVAGFPEMSVFDQLSAYVRFMFKERLLGEIYRPAAESLMQPGFQKAQQAVIEGLHAAGGQLAAGQSVARETLDIIGQPFIEPEDFTNVGNAFWKTCISEGITPKTFGRKRMTPRPDSVPAFLSILKLGFKPAAAADTRAVLQFDFTGERAETCHILIDNGAIRTALGPADRPDLTVTTPFDLWTDIMCGRADGQEMFLAQQYTADGNFELLLKFKDFFGR